MGNRGRDGVDSVERVAKVVDWINPAVVSLGGRKSIPRLCNIW